MTENDIPEPETVVETDSRPSPEVVSAWSDEQVEQYNELKKADLRESISEQQARQEAALNQIAAGGQLERYETVQLGDLEIEVKGWLPGDVEQTVRKAEQIAQDGDHKAAVESIETFLSALAEMTRNEDFDLGFWRDFYERWGPEGVLLAAEKVFEPAVDSMEDKQEAIDGFRSGTSRSGPGTRGRDDRPDAE